MKIGAEVGGWLCLGVESEGVIGAVEDSFMVYCIEDIAKDRWGVEEGGCGGVVVDVF